MYSPLKTTCTTPSAHSYKAVFAPNSQLHSEAHTALHLCFYIIQVLTNAR
jgi:hypothetical protein